MQVVSVLGIVAVCYVPVLAFLGVLRATGSGSTSGGGSDDEVPVYSWDGDDGTDDEVPVYSWDGDDGTDDEYHSETVLDGETPESPTDSGGTDRPDVTVRCPRCDTPNDSRFAYCQECVRPLSQPSMAD